MAINLLNSMSGGGREDITWPGLNGLFRNAFREICALGHSQFYVCRSGGRRAGGWAGGRPQSGWMVGRASGRALGRAIGRADGRGGRSGHFDIR